MASLSDWKVPVSAQPRPGDYDYDLDAALASMVGLRSLIPADAFTAETLGTERAGHGVIIRTSGLILTIGYLITEAETIWLHLSDGRVVPGHALTFDQETGFGLVQPLARLNLPALPLGRSATAQIGERVVIAGSGGRERSVAARIVGKQEFAGYWEYVLDEAIFTAPAHPNWGGTAMIGMNGELLGIGSLQLERGGNAEGQYLNLIVPIDLLTPILDDLLTLGHAQKPARPWLGIYSTEAEGRIIIVGLAARGPAARADLRTGDIIVAVDGEEVDELATLYRKIWSLGVAGVEVPLTIFRDGDTFDVRVNSGDRMRFLKSPKLH
ncbi:MAG: S1C family serine protease [Pseudorhodoplanes sp.]|jgi:S1-C subfamily serine protease|nr:S1C family serine protease [Pseudorhodoplanes sp.]